ncbi:MFS transporter [Aspergillus saccharolyticus JOP 1030-1]|uniref:MFS general substrate transporter n=1 Tax=Aspergillus saccharolyticus JOP 1030-1 TaxID=1450539 RepID=A0A318Z7R0_9EURO|nr:MFS general substrate transporter [Aspergillus saccharolyticus JOP 1030-1]PYH42457.1 MFS general substrate transporter [Aspergillus saccharolyticus JOP 1030-1]
MSIPDALTESGLPNNVDEPFLPSKQIDDPREKIPPHMRRRLLVSLIAILLSFQIGGQMIGGPMVRVIEMIACNNYWRRQDPARLPMAGHLPEHLCKAAEVQTEVATVKGYSDLLEGLLCAICAIPYGLLADRYGRRRAIRLTVPGYLLNAVITNSVLWFSDTFPLRAIWFAAVSWIIGGGPVVAVVAIWAMLADITTDAQRATLFFRIGLANQVTSFLASLISAGLMAVDPWIPLLIGCGAVTMGLGCALSLPETMNLSVKTTASPEPGLGPLGTSGDTSFVEPVCTSRPWPATITRLVQPYLFICHPRLLLLLCALSTGELAQRSSSFLTQHISTRFGWTLAQAHFLVSFYAAVTILVFLVLLPYLSKRILRHLSLPMIELQIARLSTITLLLGSIGIGTSPSVLVLVSSLSVYATGAGFALAIRSLVTALVKQEETARLYSAVELVQYVGTILGSLCFTNVFRLGINSGGLGSGWVWVLGSLLYASVGVALAFVRV